MKKNLIFSIILIFLNIYVFGQGQWVSQNIGTSNYLYSVNFPSLDTGYVCDEAGQIFKTTNGGTNWNIVSTISDSPSHISFINNDTGVISGDLIMKTIDGGFSWEQIFPDSNFTFNYVKMISADTIVAVCDDDSFNSKAFMSYNGGNSWNMIGYFPLTYFTFSGYFINSKLGYVAVMGNIYKTVNSGSTWVTDSIDENYNVYSMFFTDNDTGIAVRDNGTLLYTYNSGNSWEQINTGFTNPLYSVYFTSHDTGYAVGGNGYNSGTVIKTYDGGQTWLQAKSTTHTFNCIQFPNANTGYAAGDNGTILKYTSSTGITESKGNDFTISIYPNPVNDYTTINIPDYFNKNEMVLELSDINGNLIKGYTINKNTIKLNVSNLPSGIYTIKVKNKDKFAIKKIVKI